MDVVTKDYTDLTTDPTPMTYVRAFNQVDPPVSATPALFPAPTLCVNPGDEIQLQVANKLPNDTGSTTCPGDKSRMNQPNCFNTINMHFHGLHVSPISLTRNGTPISAGQDKTVVRSSDDVLYELETGKNHPYCPWLPAFHAPGTHWYHAHRHGSTAIQVAGGMVGAIIVKEPPGQEICPEAPDIVMIIQEEPQSTNGQTNAQEDLDLGIYNRPGNSAGGTFRVNGNKNPTLNLKKDEIQRWRIINGNSTPRSFMKLELRLGDNTVVDSKGNPNGTLVTLYRIAIDGITLYGKSMNDSSVKVSNVPFAPGNRVDLLINLDTGTNTGTSTYTLWKIIDSTLVSGSMAGNSPPEALVTINVDNETTFADKTKVQTSFQKLLNNGIPTTGKPAYLDPIPTVDQENTTPVVFQANNPTGFRISNTKYSSSITNIEADLNSTQEWIVANAQGGAAHPFHIHVNPFLVVETATINQATIKAIGNVTGTDSAAQKQIYDLLDGLTTWTSSGIDPTIWWDTFSIPPKTAFRIRHRFDDYWGNYVLHCHVLIHEDQGMMWNVQINNVQGQGANPCEQLLEPVVIAEQPVANLPFTTGTKIALQADTGEWLSRCNNCQQTVGNKYPDTVTVHIDNPDSSNPYAQFEILDVGGGKIALKADTGKYVARCHNCITHGAYPDFLTVHVDDPSVPYAQFTPELLENGKYALKADTGKYVARCRNCSIGAAYPDTVTIHVDDPTNAPYAQWNIRFIQ